MEFKKTLPIIIISLIAICYLSLFSYEQYLNTKSYELSLDEHEVSIDAYKLSLKEFDLKIKAHNLSTYTSVMEYCMKYNSKNAISCIDGMKSYKYEK